MTSLGMFVGNLWILVKCWFQRDPSYPVQTVAKLMEVPIGGVKLFRYPSPDDPCILVRGGLERHVAYSQKCTHLSCVVYYSQEDRRLECPCHNGAFSVTDGRVLYGPSPRPLPKVTLERRGEELVATSVQLRTEP